jgi:hypothetical protein
VNYDTFGPAPTHLQPLQPATPLFSLKLLHSLHISQPSSTALPLAAAGMRPKPEGEHLGGRQCYLCLGQEQ